MIVIATTGQSNATVARPFVWSPSANAQLWNNVPETDGGVGTTFMALSTTTTNVMWKFASEIARLNPGQQICLINVGFSGQAISHWLSGYSGNPVVLPDIYANLTANVVAGLASCGATKIDYFAYWQGEADANGMNANYSAQFAALMGRVAGESWFAPTTKTVILGISPSSISGVAYSDVILSDLAAQAAVDPNRRFVPSGVFPINPYWDTSTPGHMHGEGYDAVGALAANFATEKDPGFTPYNVTVSSGTGSLISYVSAGRYTFLPGKTVVFTAQATVTSNGNGGGHLRVSLPFPPRSGSYFSGGSAFDAYSGEILSVAIAPSDPLNAHVFTAAVGYPLGKSVVVTGIYERQ